MRSRAAATALALSIVIVIGLQLWQVLSWQPTFYAASTSRTKQIEPKPGTDGKVLCQELVCWDYEDGSRICGWRYYLAESCS